MFNLIYYSNGFGHSDVYSLPVYLRRFYSQQLLSVKETERKAAEESSKSNKSSMQPQNPFRSQ